MRWTNDHSRGGTPPQATDPLTLGAVAIAAETMASGALASPLRAWRVNQFCKAHGIGRTTFYSLVKNGDLKVRKVGKSTLVDADEAARWWASCAQGMRR